MKKLFYRFGNLFYLRTGKKFQVQQNLIISGTTTMYFLSDITQTTGQHQFYLRMYIFHPVFYHKFTFFGRGINTLQFHQQLVQFFFCQQPNAFKHRNMSHRTKHIMLGQIKIHLTITTYRETFDILIYLYGLLPKFLCHKKKFNIQ